MAEELQTPTWAYVLRLAAVAAILAYLFWMA